MRTAPPFRADHVGGHNPTGQSDRRTPGGQARRHAGGGLRRIQEQAIHDVVRLQEDIGLKVATDGEFNRGSWQRDFLLRLDNVELIPSRLTVRFHSAAGTRDHSPPSLQVTGRLRRPGGIFVDDFRFLRSVARAEPKVTVPSPTVLHFRGGRDAIDRAAYPDMEEFYADLARVYAEEISDLAAAGCRYLQIDEVNLAYLCDPPCARRLRRSARIRPALPKTYAKLLNDAIAAPRDMKCACICAAAILPARGSPKAYDRSPISCSTPSTWTAIFSNTSPRAGSFAPLRHLPRARLRSSASSPPEPRLERGRPQAPHRRGQSLRPARAARLEPAMRVLQRHRRAGHDGGGESPSSGSSSASRATSGARRDDDGCCPV